MRVGRVQVQVRHRTAQRTNPYRAALVAPPTDRPTTRIRVRVPREHTHAVTQAAKHIALSVLTQRADRVHCGTLARPCAAPAARSLKCMRVRPPQAAGLPLSSLVLIDVRPGPAWRAPPSHSQYVHGMAHGPSLETNRSAVAACLDGRTASAHPHAQPRHAPRCALVMPVDRHGRPPSLDAPRRACPPVHPSSTRTAREPGRAGGPISMRAGGLPTIEAAGWARRRTSTGGRVSGGGVGLARTGGDHGGETKGHTGSGGVSSGSARSPTAAPPFRHGRARLAAWAARRRPPCPVVLPRRPWLRVGPCAARPVC